jgi:hypothetical protein
LMERAAGETPKMWGPSIIGFGSYHYSYDSGREGDMPLIGFSPRKSATVLYNVTGFSHSEALPEKSGKHTTGKACLYVKTLADVDQKVLEALIVKSVAAMRARYPIQGSASNCSTAPAHIPLAIRQHIFGLAFISRI